MPILAVRVCEPFNGPLLCPREIAAEPGTSIAVHSELGWNILGVTAEAF